jgi:hypothetical protein
LFKGFIYFQDPLKFIISFRAAIAGGIIPIPLSVAGNSGNARKFFNILSPSQQAATK